MTIRLDILRSEITELRAQHESDQRKIAALVAALRTQLEAHSPGAAKHNTEDLWWFPCNCLACEQTLDALALAKGE